MNEKTPSISSMKYSGLTVRVLVSVVLCSTVLAGGFSWLHYQHVSKLFYTALNQQVQVIRDGFTPALVSEIYADDKEGVDFLLRAMISIPCVVYVQLDTDIPVHQQHLKAGDFTAAYDENHIIDLPSQRTKSEGKSIGKLHVRVCHGYIRKGLRTELKSMVFCAIVFVVVLSVLYFTVFQLNFTRHLLFLAKHLKQLNIDNLHQSMGWSQRRKLRYQSDELDLVAHRIDELCQDLHRKIQEREQALKKLAISEEFYRQLVEDQTELVVRGSAENKVTYVNQAMCRFLGVSSDQLLDQGYEKIFDVDDMNAINSMHEILSSQNPVAFGEYPLTHSTLGKRLVSWTSRGYFDEQGNLIQMQCTGRDITEQAKVLQELRLRDHAIRSTPYGIVITEPNLPDNPAVYVNPAFEKMTGYSADEILGKNIRFLHRGDHEQPDLPKLRLAIEKHSAVNVTLRNYRKDGSMYWVELIIAPMHDPQGKLTHFVSVQTDVTDRKQTDESQKRLTHELDHRVKNVLATVIALASQTLRSSTDMKIFTEVFSGRIHALARAHEALAKEHWDGIYMDQLAHVVLDHQLSGMADRIQISGPKVRLLTRLSQPLCMTLHELLTNAMKYGVLKKDSGMLRLTWEVVGDLDHQTVHIHWREDCPTCICCCDGSSQPGVGMRLVEGLVIYEMNGQLDHYFTEQGLHCEITLPNYKNNSNF